MYSALVINCVWNAFLCVFHRHRVEHHKNTSPKKSVIVSKNFTNTAFKSGGVWSWCSLVPRRSRRGQSWTLPWAVTSPGDTRQYEAFSGPLFPRFRADNGSREKAYGLGWSWCRFACPTFIQSRSCFENSGTDHKQLPDLYFELGDRTGSICLCFFRWCCRINCR